MDDSSPSSEESPMTHIATPSHLITDGVGGIFELPSVDFRTFDLT